MKRETARIILYQLGEAKLTLEAIANGADGKEAAFAYAMRTLSVAKYQVDEFFATEYGQRIARQFEV